MCGAFLGSTLRDSNALISLTAICFRSAYGTGLPGSLDIMLLAPAGNCDDPKFNNGFGEDAP
ncbi:MAG: hypothetical protein M3R08_04655 [Bacteroidota bacterium]|nr:hypothetical protein [Bacteroidota bacterium]